MAAPRPAFLIGDGPLLAVLTRLITARAPDTVVRLPGCSFELALCRRG